MVATNADKLLNLAEFNYYSDTFIETGTCNGEGVERAIIAGYPIIRTVELKEEFYTSCQERFKNYRPELKRWCQVHLYQGKSTDKLAEMLQASPEKCVIFLDAHPAGPQTAGHDDLMENGAASEFNQHNIISRELEIIVKHGVRHIIIIDDQHGLDAYNKQYMEILFTANPDYRFMFYDEQLAKHGTRYQNKWLVCTPF